MGHGGRIGRVADAGARMLILALAGAVLWFACPARAADFGELIVLQGTAVVTRAGKSFVVHRRAAVQAGDRVDTRAHTRAQLVIGAKEQGMEALISSRTTLTVNALQHSPGAAAPLSLAFGALRTRLRAWSGPPFIATRAATVGIKGTDFVTWVKRPEAAEFVGLAGLIECVSRSVPGYSIRIGRRQWGQIVENEKPMPPIRVPDDLWNAVQKEFAFPGE